MECLPELDADRTAPKDDQFLGQRLEVEHGLVGEVLKLGKARDGRHNSVGAGGDDDLPRLDLNGVARHRPRIDEPRALADNLHAKALEP